MRTGAVEITDLLWCFEPTGVRRPVVRADVLAALTTRGQHRAAGIVARMPATDGILDAAYVDALAIRVHCELQRLEEELQFGRRVAHLLRPLVERVQADGGAVRIVDVGCGLGFVLRALAATDSLGPAVELVGVDLNAVLVAEAARLAERENLRCRFVCGDALAPGVAVDEGPTTVVISSGLLHHLSADELTDFFAGQERLGVAAYAHWDITPCVWSTLGAWVFHRARMREAVSRHDGVLSARRAHPASVLRTAAARGAPRYDTQVPDEQRWRPAALDVLRPVVGVRR